MGSAGELQGGPSAVRLNNVSERGTCAVDNIKAYKDFDLADVPKGASQEGGKK